MKSGLLVLPFLSVLLLAITKALSSAFLDWGWIPYVGYSVAGLVLVAWVWFDWKNFVAFFKRKGTKYGVNSGGVMILVLASLVGLAYVTQKETFNKRWDVTKNEVSSLSQESLDLIEKFAASKEVVQITGYFYSAEVKGNFERLAKIYMGHGAPLQLNFIDPKKNPEQVVAAKLTSENTAIFDFAGRTSEITSFSEEEITNVLLNIIKEGSKTVYFTKGHGEPSVGASDASGFSLVKELLGKQKIQVKDVSLVEEGKIPDDADLLVIASPQYDFREGEVELLSTYLKQGGAVALSVSAAVSLPILFNWVAENGLKIEDDILLFDTRDPRSIIYGRGAVIVSEFDGMNGITKKI